ncbi:MAG: sigma-70 family RNA polymerase sigma factor [Verrucomicrobiota bacterium]
MTSSSADNFMPAEPAGARPDFPTTHWTLVTRVRQGGEVRQAALEELCHLYWYPIYAFLRRRGYSQHDAEDCTQGFFIKLLNDESLTAAGEGKGRLRTYLLQHLKRHIVDRKRFDGALKRGAGQRPISFEEMGAEDRYAREPLDLRDPERLFGKAWANELIAGVREKLRADFADTKRPQAFDLLLPFLLLDTEPPSYREVAAKLQATEISVRLMVHRLRGRFRDLLRDEVARTLKSQVEVDAEIDWLKSVLRPP